jgi:transposase, IS30 family
VDRPASTISRELKRNSGSTVGYQPGYAQEQARARRWSRSRLERDPLLREGVLGRLVADGSPEQIAGRLAREAGRPLISHESIYRFIHAQITRTNDHGWRRCLPRAKSKRGWRGRKGGSAVNLIPSRVPLSKRPEADRASPGHWEADLMLFASHGQAILAVHERSSRLTLITRLPGKAAAPIADQLVQWRQPLPPMLRSTISFDNGTKFARHQRLHKIGTQTFFCNTHSPWQKRRRRKRHRAPQTLPPPQTNLNISPTPHALTTIPLENVSTS